MESGWAVGAVAGGFAAGFLVKRIRPARVLMTSLITLAIGNALFPYARWLAHCHDHARNFRGLPRAGRSADAVRDHDGGAAAADGADAIDVCGAFDIDADPDEFFAGVAGGIFGIAGCVCVVGDYLCRRGGGGVSRAFDGAGGCGGGSVAGVGSSDLLITGTLSSLLGN